MSFFKNPLLEILAILIVLLIGGIFAVRFATNTLGFRQNDLPAVTSYQPPSSVTQNSEVISADGTAKLAMQTMMQEDSVVSYSFFVTESESKNQRLLFAKETSDRMSIPKNSWAPDNKYVFLLQDIKGSADALVFKSSGVAFQNNEQYLDIAPLFTKRNTGYTIRSITGWASPTLLILYTDTDQKTEGPPFWFDVTTQGFTQLAR